MADFDSHETLSMQNEIPRSLLQDLFEATDFGRKGVKRLRYRTDHIHDASRIDWCERTGLIRLESDHYFLSLFGLAEIDTEESRGFFATAELAYASMGQRYRENPGNAVLIMELASEFGLRFEDMFYCVELMFECYPCFGGFSGRHAIDKPSVAMVVPSEPILQYPTFKTCVEHLQKMRANMHVDVPASYFALQAVTPLAFASAWPTERLRSAVPQDQARLLEEVYTAIEHKLFTLASVGIRTVIDMVFLDRIGDIGSFQEKMADLHKKGLISKIQAEVLLKVIDAGNASAHRGYTPDPKDVDILVEVVEHLLTAIYQHPTEVAELAKKTPARPPKVRR